MRGSTRGRPTDSYHPPPAQQSRDSDASYASSRPSSVAMGRGTTAEPYADRAFQVSTIRSINAFFTSHSIPPLSTKHSQAPSAKDLSNILTSLLSLLGFPCSKLEEDLGILLKSLNCPFKFNKSTLRAPNTPHNWPNWLAIVHWLVQLAIYNENLSHNNNTSSFAQNNSMTEYALECYMQFIRGEDDVVDVLDKEFVEKLDRERENVVENCRVMEKSVSELEAKAEGLRTGPTEKEKLEREKSVLEEDVNKFHAMIAEFNGRVAAMEKVLEEKEKELNAKEEERKNICQENDELKKRVELQTFNARDVERMKREMQAVEKDVVEAEVARNTWEDKSWDLDSAIGHKFKELTSLAMECNQAIRRLKLGNDFQYEVNANGSTPVEVMGIDYKGTLKPELESYADKIRESSKRKFEDMIVLQQQSKELAAKIEEKKNCIAALQSRIDEVDAQINLIQKEMQECDHRTTAEVKKMVEDIQVDAHKLDITEREAAEILKASQLRLQEAIQQSEEEIQMHASQLFMVVDSVSKYKEHVESKISEMRVSLSETAAAVSDAYKGSLPAQFTGNANANPS